MIQDVPITDYTGRTPTVKQSILRYHSMKITT